MQPLEQGLGYLHRHHGSALFEVDLHGAHLHLIHGVTRAYEVEAPCNGHLMWHTTTHQQLYEVEQVLILWLF